MLDGGDKAYWIECTFESGNQGNEDAYTVFKHFASRIQPLRYLKAGTTTWIPPFVRCPRLRQQPEEMVPRSQIFDT